MRVLAHAKLAELRILQGRDGEALDILRDREDDRLAARAMIMLRLARGEPEIAAALAERRLDALRGNPLFGAPILELSVHSYLQAGDVARATDASTRLSAFANTCGLPVVHASAAHAAAVVALAASDAARAREHFERAIDAYQVLAMPLEESRARLGIARALAGPSPEAAKAAARAALSTFERIGAARDVDAANAVLRSLGVAGAPGPRRTGRLSAREQEVFDLLPLGLSNAEIGARLFISPKTVEHHVSQILAKLEVKTRAAAAAAHAKRRKSGAE
jgi:DNA-binding NarL/FixJ family response regulator